MVEESTRKHINKIYLSGIKSIDALFILFDIDKEKIRASVGLPNLNKITNKTESWRRKGRDRVRFLVRERDDFTCQKCKKVWQEGSRHFDVHHLNGLCGKKSHGYDSIKDMPGLITLCHKCHFNHPEHSRKL